MATKAEQVKARRLVRQAIEQYNNQDYPKAIALLNRAVKLYPTHARAWNNRGLCRVELGQFDEAIKDFERALKLVPGENKYEILNNLGELYVRLRAFDKAEDNFEASLNLSPENSIAKNWLSRIAERKEAQVTLESNQDELRNREKKAQDTIISLDDGIFGAWMIMVFIIGLYFVLVIYPAFDTTENAKDIGDFFVEKIFLISPLLILIFPFIWGIRMLNTAKDKQEIMREDYYRRMLIDAIMLQVFDPLVKDTPEVQKQKRKVWAESIQGWLHHSPAEMLLQTRTKIKSDGEASPQERVIKEIYKNFSVDKK